MAHGCGANPPAVLQSKQPACLPCSRLTRTAPCPSCLQPAGHDCRGAALAGRRVAGRCQGGWGGRAWGATAGPATAVHGSAGWQRCEQLRTCIALTHTPLLHPARPPEGVPRLCQRCVVPPLLPPAWRGAAAGSAAAALRGAGAGAAAGGAGRAGGAAGPALSGQVIAAGLLLGRAAACSPSAKSAPSLIRLPHPLHAPSPPQWRGWHGGMLGAAPVHPCSLPGSGRRPCRLQRGGAAATCHSAALLWLWLSCRAACPAG